MKNKITINDIYNPKKPFTSKIAKQIVDHFGEKELDKILLQRVYEDVKGIDTTPNISQRR